MLEALCIQAKPANACFNRDSVYELPDCWIALNKKKLKGGAFVGALCTSACIALSKYTRENVKDTPFVQPINLASLATTFILTLRMARAPSQNVGN